MTRFRSWTGGQLAVFSGGLVFAGLLLFLGYRRWDGQYWDQVEVYHRSWRQAIETCRSVPTATCNEIMQPYMDASIPGLIDSYRHREIAGWLGLAVIIMDLLVIPGVLGYMAFQWFGAQRRRSA